MQGCVVTFFSLFSAPVVVGDQTSNKVSCFVILQSIVSISVDDDEMSRYDNEHAI